MIFIIVVMAIFIFMTRGTASKLRPPLPPGPKPFPFIGSLIPMLRNKPTFRWIHRMMNEMNTNILCIRLGNVNVIVVSDPKIACEFLKDKDEIFSSRPDCMSGFLVSSGYLTTALVPMSDYWKKMRKTLATNVLSVAKHKWLQNKRDEEANNMIRYIYEHCENNVAVTTGVVNLRTVVQQYSINTIRKMMFGSRYFSDENADIGVLDEDVEYVNSLWTILDYLYSFSVTDYFPRLRWITDFEGHEVIMRNAICIDVFINLEDPRLRDDQIKAQILELVLAAFDNPSNAVEWAMAEMISQPRIFDRAIQELDCVVGKDRLVQESDTPKLNYIKACVKEAFRLHPVSPFNLPHVAIKDTTVSGYYIPKGSHVLISRLGLGRNPEVWDNPLTFNPERHICGDTQVVLTDHNLETLSFSTGRRGCPGVLFGSTMTIMLLARLVQGFTWELPPNESYVDLKENLQDLAKSKPLFSLAKSRLPHHLYTI